MQVDKIHKNRTLNPANKGNAGAFIAFVLACFGYAGSSLAQTAQPQDAAADAGPNAMTRAAVQRGVLSCAARVQQVTQFLGFGPQASGMLMAPANPVDQRLFSMLMEAPAGATGNSYVDMTFAPSQANGCGATYASVSFMAQNCDAVASGPYAQFKKMPAIKQDVVVLDGGASSKVFLMKAGANGCIVIKKEIVL